MGNHRFHKNTRKVLHARAMPTDAKTCAKATFHHLPDKGRSPLPGVCIGPPSSPTATEAATEPTTKPTAEATTKAVAPAGPCRGYRTVTIGLWVTRHGAGEAWPGKTSAEAHAPSGHGALPHRSSSISKRHLYHLLSSICSTSPASAKPPAETSAWTKWR